MFKLTYCLTQFSCSTAERLFDTLASCIIAAGDTAEQLHVIAWCALN